MVLALRLNKVISMIIHLDQYGFVPQRLRRLTFTGCFSTCRIGLITWGIGLCCL